MTASARDQVTCRECGAMLGTLNRHRDKLTLRPGVAQQLELRSLGFGLICPSCGHYRLMRAGKEYRQREERTG